MWLTPLKLTSGRDIGLYGGLCSLATMDRDELKRRVIDNTYSLVLLTSLTRCRSFKHFLELAPEMRELIKDFYNSRYGSCLKHLNQLRNELLLDVYIHAHVKTLYKSIREKALVQVKSCS